jgi:hypothetical protein
MTTGIRFSLLAGLLLLSAPLAFAAPQEPSFAKHIMPFFARYCVECHNSAESQGGLDLETYKSLREGGNGGDVLKPGKADASDLLLVVEHKKRPVMPPRRSKQPRPEEVALLRAWIDAGARDDSKGVRVALPDILPRMRVAAPVTAVAYHPEGKMLAAAGRKRVSLFEPATADLLGEIYGQYPQVTSLAFRPDGKMLAVASSAVGEAHVVRLYDVSSGEVSDGESGIFVNRHQDVIQDVAFSPDGKLLASCGYDRVIKVWDVAGATKKELHTLKDHSDSVYAVAFSPDGKLLASAAADRAVKVWDVATGKRLYTLGEATDWLYSVAWSPDGKHLAAGGVDRSIRVWQVSAAGGKIAQSVFAHEVSVLRLVYSRDGKTLYSLGEDRTVKAWDTAKMVERQVYPRQPETVLSLAVRSDDKQLALGRYDGVLLLLDAATGKPQAEPLPLKRKPPVKEAEPNDSPRTGQALTLPATVTGSIARAGDVDFYRLEALAGQEIGVQVVKAEAKLETVLQLTDAEGHILIESTNGLLGYKCPSAGVYSLGIRDREYRGDPGMSYRLNVGALPIITSVSPLGLQRGTEAEFQLEGVNLGTNRAVRIKAPADAAPGSRLPIPVPAGTLGNPTVLVDEFPQAASTTGSMIPVPGTANGRIEQPGSTQTWRFSAKKGQRLLVEVNARRAGSPLDSVIEILDSHGEPLPRATLRCLAQTYVIFRDHDSVGTGIRIESWSELAIDDYILVGSELMRIRELPKNPDDDCQFHSRGGKRRAYLGTTPTFHPQGQPMYKVAIHPPGTTFSPNGLPIITLYYRNDDGGGPFGKDSRLVFDPPADGDYQVRIGDARGQGSRQHVYQLTVRPPRPSFSVSFTPNAPAVEKGGAVAITVTADRRDEFDGPIEVKLLNQPPGFSAPPTTILPGETSTSFALYAEPTASVPGKASPLKLVARAVIDGQEMIREATGGTPKVIEPGDIRTTTEQAEVTLKPGGEVHLTVAVERRNGFKGRIPVEVKGLPHGVRVLDIGLNGILITPQDTRRTMVLYAEPWVEPMTHPFVVQTRREGKTSVHAARSVLLRVSR